MAEHTFPVALKHVCGEPAASHGARVLVERLWSH